MEAECQRQAQEAEEVAVCKGGLPRVGIHRHKKSCNRSAFGSQDCVLCCSKGREVSSWSDVYIYCRFSILKGSHRN
jgi:hypothetical protein